MRLFLALVPPAPVRLALRLTMGGLAGARWQSDEQLHLTMRFLGEVDRHTAEALVDALDGDRFASIEASVEGLGYFASKGVVSALWAGVAPREPLLRLHQRLDRHCVRLGLAPDTRKFVPHVTLARFGRRAAPSEDVVSRWIAETPAPQVPPFVFARLVLFESTLGQDGAAYSALAHFPMDGG